MKALRVTFGHESPYVFVAGTGGIGSGIFFQLESNRTLGRNESRGGQLLDWKDYCKLHIVFHYISVFLGADTEGKKFRVLPIGKVGNDDAGPKLTRQMADVGMDISNIETVSGVSTLFSVCFQYPNGAGGNITSSNSASSLIAPQDIDKVAPIFGQYSGKGIAVALPEVSLEARRRLLELGTRYDFFRAASFTSTEVQKAIKKGIMADIDLIGLNEDEAKAIAKISHGMTVKPPHDERALKRLLDGCTDILTRHNPDIEVAITAGSKGAYGYRHGRWEHVARFEAKPINTAGAGDAYLSGLIISTIAGLPFIREDQNDKRYLKGRSVETSMDFASLLASFKVTSKDTIHWGADAESLCQYATHLGVGFSPTVARLFGFE